MMWWDDNDYSGGGWWWPGILIMCVFMIVCMVMMARMMLGHGGHSPGTHGSHWGGSPGSGPDGAERRLADRLASGEIDVDDYERSLEALRRARGSADEAGDRVRFAPK